MPITQDMKELEEPVWKTVHSHYPHLVTLYTELRNKIYDSSPQLAAELESGGPGWIKFKNRSLDQYAKFGLVLKRDERIEVWFKSNSAAPSKEEVDAKDVKSAMHRKSGKGFYISATSQIDDEIITWLVDC